MSLPPRHSWFSNGCAIGCETCDGVTRGPIPSAGSKWRRKFDVCGAKAQATVCDPAHRTVNTDVTCGADDDWYYYFPWRAPGSAGVFDSCGMAGGTPHPGPGAHSGFGGHYAKTSHAKQGDLGSETLPKGPASVTWKAGDVVEVAWSVLANHGGGFGAGARTYANGLWAACPSSYCHCPLRAGHEPRYCTIESHL